MTVDDDNTLIIHDVNVCMRTVISGICDFVCLVCVCPRSTRKTTRATNTKFGTHILYGRSSACIDPEVKKSNVKVTRLRRPSRSHDSITIIIIIIIIITIIIAAPLLRPCAAAVV